MVQNWDAFVVNLTRAEDWADIVANMTNFAAVIKETKGAGVEQDDDTLILKTYNEIGKYISWWLNKELEKLNILNDEQVQVFDSHVKEARTWFIDPGSVTVPFVSPISTAVKPSIMEAKRFVTQAKEQDSFDRAFPLVFAASVKLKKAYDALNQLPQLSREHRKMLTDEMNTIAYKGESVLGKKRDEELQNNPTGFGADEATDKLKRLYQTKFTGGARRPRRRPHKHYHCALQEQQRHLLHLINLYAKQ